MINLPSAERHTHDCDRCVYKGTTYSGVHKHHDWYVCPSRFGSIIKRHSSEPSDYSSSDLFGGAAAFDFVQEALREGILMLVVNPEPPELEEW